VFLAQRDPFLWLAAVYAPKGHESIALGKPEPPTRIPRLPREPEFIGEQFRHRRTPNKISTLVFSKGLS
jgi:hypothetical protein